MYRSIMVVVFRMSLVAAIGCAIYGGARGHVAAIDELRKVVIGQSVLGCANRQTDAELMKHANKSGLIDLSKIHCSTRTFYASIPEIRNPNVYGEWYRYENYVNASDISGFALAGFALVNFVGLCLVGIIMIVTWVGGPQAKSALVRVIGADRNSKNDLGVRQWIIPIVSGIIATVLGGLLVVLLST